MARFRLSTDILSPINSDISVNDGSAFSFGSLPGTPGFENFASPICSGVDINLLCAKNMKECISAFDEITNDVKKQSSTNSEKEEKYKETYDELKRSMDDLFGKNSNSPVFLPQLKNKSETENLKSEMYFEKKLVDELQNFKTPKLLKSRITHSESISETNVKKSEKTKKEKSVTNKVSETNVKKTKKHKEKYVTNELIKKQQSSKQTSSVTESIKDTKSAYDAVSNEKKSALMDQNKKINITPIKTGGTSVEMKGTKPKTLPDTRKEKENTDLKKYQFKCQKKIPISNNNPVIEHKSLSIEKSIQLAVSMEMDNVRRFVIDQNLSMHKDLLKLQEKVKKQDEVTGYLFSVIDELLDTNKKLISKCN